LLEHRAGADGRTAEHEACQILRLTLCIAHGDQPTHRVANHDHRQVARLSPHHATQVVDDSLETGDYGALPGRTPVTDVVGPDDRRTACCQCLRDMLVTTDVLAVAMHEHDQPLRLIAPPATDVQATDCRCLHLNGRHALRRS
jgi:hypothetical protein